jgi:hypothetical protein
MIENTLSLALLGEKACEIQITGTLFFGNQNCENIQKAPNHEKLIVVSVGYVCVCVLAQAPAET